MEKKYQVFLSSTYTNLKDERQDVFRSILDLGHILSGMEIFPALPHMDFLAYTKQRRWVEA
jgi:hypothetical protein